MDKRTEDDGSRHPDRLGPGLRAGFGQRPHPPPPEVPASVLQRLGGDPARVPRVLLRPAQDEHGHLIDPRSGEARDVGHYRVDGEIARGGVGVVLKGHDVDLGRDVALKVLREEHADNPEMLARFVEEAQIGGQLQHPGIVPVYELGLRGDRRPFFTMKLVKGRTLAAKLSERAEIVEDRRRYLVIFEAMCQTMAYAHARGVVHRDLKPSNVMVGAFGEVQVVDWGLAKVLARGGTADEELSSRPKPEVSVIATVRSGSTGTDSLAGSVMGTPAYMPPEQARGEVESIDERSDVFSLGAVLCEILTGRPPYAGDSRNLLRQAASGRLEGALARLEKCGAEPELVEIARSCLEPDPAARPRSAGVVAERMSRYMSLADERARSAELEAAEARVRALSERRARKLTVALAASVLLTLVLGGGGWWWVEARRSDRLAEARRVVNEALEEVAFLSGQERWSEALGAARHAGDLAQTGEAETALVAKASAVLRDTQASAERSRATAEQARKDQQMIARLDEILAAAGYQSSFEYADLFALRDRQYREAFRDYGIEIDAIPMEESVRRISASSIRLRLSLALDAWAIAPIPGESEERIAGKRAELVAIARITDPDPWRNRLRDATDLATLQSLAREADPELLDANTLLTLSGKLKVLEDYDGTNELLVRSVEKHPDDYWLHHTLAVRLTNGEGARRLAGASVERLDVLWSVSDGSFSMPGSRPERALPHAIAVVALRPGRAGSWSVLANARFGLGDFHGAIDAYRRALALDPSPDSWVHMNLGLALLAAGQARAALVEFEQTARHRPESDLVWFNLAGARMEIGDRRGAIEAVREAICLDAGRAFHHLRLAELLEEEGDLENAIESAREAIRLEPAFAYAHGRLGGLLAVSGDDEGGVASYREALRLEPGEGWTHYCLACALKSLGRYDEAIASLDRAHELKEDDPDRPYEATRREWVRLASGQERLPAILRGELVPEGGLEAADAAWRCYTLRRFAQAAALYADALAADASLAGDPVNWHRYNGACCAALAAAGAGEDAAELTSDARSGLATQAIAWLREELALIEGLLENASGTQRGVLLKRLEHWKTDQDLTSLRDDAGIAALADAHRADCRDLWRRQRDLIARAAAPGEAPR